MVNNRIPHFWESLRWSIMLRFVSASILTWFLGTQIGVLIEYRQLISDSPPEKIAAEIEPFLPKLAAFSETENTPAIDLQMREIAEKLKVRQRRIARYFYHNIEQDVFKEKTYAELVIFGRKGEIVADLAADLGTLDNDRRVNLSNDENILMRAALQGEKQTRRIDETNTNALAFPLVGSDGQITGAFFVRESVPFGWQEAFTKSFSDFLTDLSDFWLAVAICGFLFGFLQAHQIALRLEKIAVAVKSWSIGEFAARASETECDEIGRLARNLNEMAKSLQEVFSIRQELAMSEERNRIARDLHDSVKQQVFGLALQIGAAKAMIETKPETVSARLAEAENLVGQVQSELVNLIGELRPQTEGNFNVRLKNYVADWSRQCGIKAKVLLKEKINFTLEVENTLFRIAQESLSNIARHSRATEVSIGSERINNKFRLMIIDNGTGFDTGKSSGGLGLQTMRERSAALKNGTIAIECEKGTKITITFET